MSVADDPGPRRTVTNPVTKRAPGSRPGAEMCS